MSAVFRFRLSELYEELPGPGYYLGTIVSARCRRSSRGNPMLQVSSELDEVAEAYATVADYFVLEGVSIRGASTARRRLAELCRAAGLDPYAGEVVVAELVGARLEVKVDHDQYGQQPRLRVVGYRELGLGEVDIPD
jgi:hypothetical protein